MSMNWSNHPASWHFIAGHYVPRLAAYHLVWEVLQLPLYTIWTDETASGIALAIAHCTAGDILIGVLALLMALTLNGARSPAGDGPTGRVVLLTVLLAVAYTAVSEWFNVTNGNWSYSRWMPLLPVVPGVAVGLSPLLQWVVVPIAAFHQARRQRWL